MKRPPAIESAVDRGLAPFRGRRAAGLLPQTRMGGPMVWVLAIMVALTVVAAGGALALSNMVQTARGDLAGSATVQIVEPDEEARAAQVEKVQDILARDPSVAGFRVVPQEDIAELLEPWLGTGDEVETVPLPALVDVTLRDGTSRADYDRLGGALRQVAPQSRIDAQSDWLAPILSALSSLKWMALALIAMLGAVGAAAVWLAARNALGGNRDTVEIVHLLGGSDDQIARIFQRSILIDAVIGGALGLVAGIAMIALLGGQFAALQSGMVAGGSLLAVDWALIALVPLFAVGIAVYTARMTVLSSLRKTL
ncbi:cell division protein FtsX [Qipengyuania sphaerica]|uniref:cell division protein FtsX n=1 Tax=Qipengyuania sphaerica TaxID=2867243 RepID=UPI001C868EAC|nr:cell division protein [Qipengyuania sphaerica]MBX7541700.1 cell division protein [Qipengyuania sphaerica]